MKKPSLHKLRSQGSALLIVLLFLVLLTILTVAFLSRSTLERQLSNASFSQGKVDLVAQGSIATIIADLQQEIKDGSSSTSVTPAIPTLPTGYYYPNNPATMVPYSVLGGISHAPPPAVDGLENLVKISYRGAYFYSGNNYNATGVTRAPSATAGISVSTTTASLNNRSVTAIRWNAPLLLARQTPTSTTDYTPVSKFVAPDWIYVARDGSNPQSWDTEYIYKPSVSLTGTTISGTPGTNPVMQRYAYAMYDEGGTLDLNVAGNPSYTAMPAAAAWTYSPLQPYKNALTYADLTQLPYLSSSGLTTATGTSTTMSLANQIKLINAIVGWRNNSSASVNGTFPGYSTITGTISTASKSSLNISYSGYPLDYYVLNSNGFLNAGGLLLRSGSNANENVSNQTDNAFTSRQQLIQFFTQALGQNSTFSSSLAALENALLYLGTFSRDISQPSYAPDPNRPVGQALATQAATSGGNDMAGYANTATNQNLLNPVFLNVTATSAFTRNDGTTAVVGEPLVKKRFALNRLAWLTYMGPIADDNGHLNNSSSSSLYVAANAANFTTIINTLEQTYGFTAAFLSQGGPTNISKYFGLVWLGPNNTLVSGGASGDSSTSIGINDGTQKWKYVHGNQVSGSGLAATASTTPGRIDTLAQVATRGRDPDFFELLKSAVTVGAIAKPGSTPSYNAGALVLTTPSSYQWAKDTSVDAYTMQLGANIIAQSNVAQYCPRIIFDDGTWQLAAAVVPQEYRGVEDLPYLYRMRGTHIKITESNPAETTTNQTATGPAYAQGFTTSTTGTGEFLQVPEIFNPHNWNSSVTPVLKPTSFQLIPLSANPLNVYAGNPTALGTSQTLAWSNNNNGNSGIGGDVAGDPGEPPAFSINGEKIIFTIPLSTTGAGFFRESTLLNKPDPGSTSYFGPPVGSNVTSSGTVTVSSGTAFNNNPITSYYKGNCYVNNSFAPSCIAPSSTTDNQKYLGFNFGTVPLWFPNPSTTTITGTTPMVMTTAVTVGANQYFTYQLQYQDPITAGKWDTYDEKFLPISICGPWGGGYGMNSPLNTFLMGSQNTANYSLAAAGTAGSGASGWGYYDLIEMDHYLVVADPRTARFSSAVFTSGQTSASLAAPPYQYSEAESRWADLSQNALTSARPDYNAGWDVLGNNATSSLGFYNIGYTGILGGKVYGYTSFFAQNWADANYSGNTGLCVGDSQSTGLSGAQYYTDPDGVVRRGSAAYANAPGSPASSSVPPTAYNGLPLQTSTTYTLSGTSVKVAPITYTSRPIVLNRPFRSVAELGYTFSGTPGRNIDFATPESGYAALLDVFCISDTNDLNGLVAGKIDLNTRQAPVLNAILAGAYKDEYNATATGTATISASDAALLATSTGSVTSYGLVARTSSSTSPDGPLRNISELVGKYVSSSNITGTSPVAVDGSLSYSGFSGDLNNITTSDTSAPNRNLVQRFHEASIRALSSCGTTRVWNLMIDVIAQTGRFPSSASNLANFNVEGERRYWVHVAIDRYTGKVLDEQIEEVKE